MRGGRRGEDKSVYRKKGGREKIKKRGKEGEKKEIKKWQAEAKRREDGACVYKGEVGGGDRKRE